MTSIQDCMACMILTEHNIIPRKPNSAEQGVASFSQLIWVCLLLSQSIPQWEGHQSLSRKLSLFSWKRIEVITDKTCYTQHAVWNKHYDCFDVEILAAHFNFYFTLSSLEFWTTFLIFIYTIFEILQLYCLDPYLDDCHLERMSTTCIKSKNRFPQ